MRWSKPERVGACRRCLHRNLITVVGQRQNGGPRERDYLPRTLNEKCGASGRIHVSIYLQVVILQVELSDLNCSAVIPGLRRRLPCENEHPSSQPYMTMGGA